MTSTFDYFAGLYWFVVDQNHPEFIPVLDALQEVAVKHINTVNPDLFNWDAWAEKDFYGKWMTEQIEKDPENKDKYIREGCMHFLDRAHDILDHTKKYHLRVFRKSPGLVKTLETLKDAIVEGRNFSFYRLKEKNIKPYPELWKAIVKLVDEGIILFNEYDKKRKLWERVINWDWIDYSKRKSSKPRDMSFSKSPIKLDHRSRESVQECITCWSSYPVGFHLRKNGEERTTCPMCGKRTILTTRKMPTPVVLREDLLMISRGKYPEYFFPRTYAEESFGTKVPGISEVARHGSARIFISRGFASKTEGHYPYLVVGRTMWMNGVKEEIDSMKYAVNLCPNNARVFIAGLGLGYILLELAKWGKTSEVVVVELSQDVIDLVEPIIREWFDEKYPDFNWRVIQGDAFEAVKRNGLFDWIFFDIWMSAPAKKEEPSVELARSCSTPYLTEGGVFTAWVEAILKMRDENRAQLIAKRKETVALEGELKCRL